MVQQSHQAYKDLPYTSKVTPELLIAGTQKLDDFTKFRETLGEKLIIGTHSDKFHCDEVLACSMLLWTKQFKCPVIVRTRN